MGRMDSIAGAINLAGVKYTLAGKISPQSYVCAKLSLFLERNPPKSDDAMLASQIQFYRDCFIELDQPLGFRKDCYFLIHWKLLMLHMECFSKNKCYFNLAVRDLTKG